MKILLAVSSNTVCKEIGRDWSAFMVERQAGEVNEAADYEQNQSIVLVLHTLSAIFLIAIYCNTTPTNRHKKRHSRGSALLDSRRTTPAVRRLAVAYSPR
ncbi:MULTISPECIES: hypothetical protein [Acidovorax]|uniref:hypothetical protein n=1 Tax=Acidovorax TaxID=12916 RepID=UPI00138F997E|nr:MULTISPECIES: hypothetical protein [Acidovorax]